MTKNQKIPLVYVKKDQSEFSYFAFAVFTGSVFEQAHEKGLSHLLEHMLFKRNKYFSTQKQFSDELNGMGMVVNAFTTQFFTAYHLTFHNDYIKNAANALYQLVLHPKFDQKDMDEEVKVVINEINQREATPQEFTFTKSFTDIFPPGNPLHNPISGYKDILLKMTKKDLESYYAKYYNPENMLFFANSSMAKSVIQKVLDDCNKKYLHEERSGIVSSYNYLQCLTGDLMLMNSPKKAIYDYTKNFKNQSSMFVLISFPLDVRMTRKDLAALHIFKNFLANSMSSNLFVELREKRQLIYSVHSMIENSYTYYFFDICFSVERDQKKLKEAISVVKKAIKKYSKVDLPEKEFEKFKTNSIVKSKMYEKKSDFVFENVLVNYFQRNKRKGDIGDSDYAEEIPNVTRGYLRKVVQRNMNFNNLFTFIA
jgi:predicted Zn-dependent peptidase